MKTMSMFTNKKDMLKSIISTMDIPDNRKDISDFGNIMWLIRNMRIRNSTNEDCDSAITICKEIAREQFGS